uniref:Pco072468 n=1 Tax=Arundo donax TaxID=35708 RepID=A0A0A9B4D4_ARUDO
MFFHKKFSSSVSGITTGTVKVSCEYLVNMKGTRWPRCSASDEGPLPV